MTNITSVICFVCLIFVSCLLLVFYNFFWLKHDTWCHLCYLLVSVLLLYFNLLQRSLHDIDKSIAISLRFKRVR